MAAARCPAAASPAGTAPKSTRARRGSSVRWTTNAEMPGATASLGRVRWASRRPSVAPIASSASRVVTRRDERLEPGEALVEVALVQARRAADRIRCAAPASRARHKRRRRRRPAPPGARPHARRPSAPRSLRGASLTAAIWNGSVPEYERRPLTYPHPQRGRLRGAQAAHRRPGRWPIRPPAADCKPVMGDPGVPVLGHTLGILQDTLETSRRLHARFGTVHWVNAFGTAARDRPRPGGDRAPCWPTARRRSPTRRAGTTSSARSSSAA